MKKSLLYIIVFLLGLSLEGCKTSKHIVGRNLITVSKEDFKHLNDSTYGKYKAIILNEDITVSEVELPGLPWNHREIVGFYSPHGAWKTEIKDKILFLNDSINNEPFSEINYINPLHMRWNLMRKCQMWLYSQDKEGKIHKRRIKRKEISYERLNESVCKVRLNIKEDVTGKILMRKYYLLSPYNSVVPYNGLLTRANIYNFSLLDEMAPWQFQKDVPLLLGQFRIFLPYGDGDIIKIGDGKIDIKRKEMKEGLSSFYSTTETNLSGHGYYTKRSASIVERRVDLVTATVSNIMPLPKGSNKQPLGVKMVNEIKKNE